MPRLSIFLLGPFQTTINDKQVRFESDTARALLSYLAVESAHPHRRETLATLFWADQSQDVALKNLRHTLYRLRQSLSDSDTADPATGPQAEALHVAGQTVQLNEAANVWVDMAEFRSLLAKCAAHNHRRLEACSSCYARLVTAAQLYRGDLMSGFALANNPTYEEWLLIEREKLHIEILDVLATLTRLSIGRGGYPAALLYARRQIKLEPWREEAHVQAMQVLLLMKQRSAAIAQYAACRRALQEEFGASPSPQTEALFNHIRNSEDAAALADVPANRVYPNNLPAELTPFVGRRNELEQISNLLESPSYRLVTLVGSGGAGKTRLAIQVARSQLAGFADGVFFVHLAQLTEANQIATAIAEAVGLTLAAKEDTQTQVRALLASKEILLVLDNFEHLRDGADLLDLLLKDAPLLTLLITSRELLGLSPETVFSVEGLRYPHIGTPTNTSARHLAEDISSYEAVQLFLERSQVVSHDFDITPATAEGVARLCEQVAGMPLGLELAAAWVHLFTPAEIAASIARNYDFLTTQFGDVPEQHRSLRAVFTYSWNLLTPPEQAMFSRLSVFRGGWDPESAASVAEVPVEVLISLSAKSLITANTNQDEQASRIASSSLTRFGMHEMLRQYADEQESKNPGAMAALKLHHTDYFTELAEQLGPLIGKSTGAEARLRLRQETGNLNAALEWTINNREQQRALRLVASMLDSWRRENTIPEGRKWSDAALALPGGEHSALRAQVLNNAAALARMQGDHDKATRLLEECLSIRRELGEPFAIAEALNTLGGIQMGRKNFAQAIALYEESLLYLDEETNLEQRCWVRTNIGSCLTSEKLPEKSIPIIRESIAGFEKLGDQFGVAYALGGLSDALDAIADYEQSIATRKQSLVYLRELDNRTYLGLALAGLSLTLHKANRAREAFSPLKEALPILWATGGPLLRFELMECGVRLAISYAGPPRAVRFMGAFQTLLKAHSDIVYEGFMSSMQDVIPLLDGILPQQERDAAWHEGSLWTLDKIWAQMYALAADFEDTEPIR